MKPIIAWFAKNHVAANLLMGLIILAGLLSLPSMPMKPFPDLEIPIISISVPYLGAAPEEVEEGVCVRIEEELEGIEGVKQIRSNASEGMCGVQVELFEDADESKALDEVKNRVDSIDTFPEETEKPIVNLVTISRSVLDIAVTGPEDEAALKETAYQIRDDIVQLPGVTQATVANTRAYEISIEVSEASLRRFNLSFDQVAAAVRSGSLDLPGGSIKTEAGEILLRTKGQAYRGHEFEELVIATRSDGTRLYLRDVARVVDGFADTDQALRFNGKPAALIRVSRLGEQDLQHVSGTVKQYIQDVGPRLPRGLELTIWNDGSRILSDRLDTLLSSARTGFLLVLIILASFLRPRIAFWVSVGVPVAFLGAIFLTNALGMSIDAISLFGFILVLGILVDDAIVVGESVHARHQEGVGRLAGAIEGAQRVTIPVTFGVLTTVAAFMPLLFGVGNMGQVMSVIAATVLCCLTFSLIESQLVLPAHLGNGKVSSEVGEVGVMLLPIFAILLSFIAWDLRSYLAIAIAIASIMLALHAAGRFQYLAGYVLRLQEGFAKRVESLIDIQFRAAARAAIKARYVSAAVAFVALLSAVAILASGRLPFSFFPPLASDQVIAKLTMPLGTSGLKTNQAIEQLEKSAGEVRQRLNREYPDSPPVTHILAAVGEQPSTIASVGPRSQSGSGTGGSANDHLGEVILQLTPSRTRDIKSREVAELWRELNGPIADAIELKFDANLFSAGNDIDIQLESDNVEELRVRFGRANRSSNSTPSLQERHWGCRWPAWPGRCDRLFTARRPSVFSAGGTMCALWFAIPTKSAVRWGPWTRWGFSTIRRTDRRRVVNVIADVDRTRITANEVIADLRSGPIQAIMAGHPRVSYTLEGQQADQAENVAQLVPIFAMALFIIYALLAVPLRSYIQPLIIMSVIPFAFMGAVWGHLIMKTFGFVSGIAFMSIMGFVAASGVVVNSSLVLVHSVNYRRTSGEPLGDIVLDAAVSRCRPIILTSLTTFIGLSPLMLNTSVQAQFLVPMAVSLAFGVLFATVVTLLVVPSGYLILDDLGGLFRKSNVKSASAH
jgi:multidrug efflux pump subunit AcrB